MIQSVGDQRRKGGSKKRKEKYARYKRGDPDGKRQNPSNPPEQANGSAEEKGNVGPEPKDGVLAQGHEQGEQRDGGNP